MSEEEKMVRNFEDEKAKKEHILKEMANSIAEAEFSLHHDEHGVVEAQLSKIRELIRQLEENE